MRRRARIALGVAVCIGVLGSAVARRPVQRRASEVYVSRVMPLDSQGRLQHVELVLMLQVADDPEAPLPIRELSNEHLAACVKDIVGLMESLERGVYPNEDLNSHAVEERLYWPVMALNLTGGLSAEACASLLSAHRSALAEIGVPLPSSAAEGRAWFRSRYRSEVRSWVPTAADRGLAPHVGALVAELDRRHAAQATAIIASRSPVRLP